MRPLNGAEGNGYLLEVPRILEFAKDLIIQIRFSVESLDAAVEEKSSLAFAAITLFMCNKDCSALVNRRQYSSASRAFYSPVLAPSDRIRPRKNPRMPRRFPQC